MVRNFFVSLLFGAALSAAVQVHSAPQGPIVVHGTAGFANPHAGALHVTNSPGAIINWQGFSVAQDELVRFIQQSSSSAVLNRVVGQNPSNILGRLLSNGRVFLINPNGLVFGSDSVIDTAGFVASTLNITDGDFLAGRLNFEGDGASAAIENRGFITTGPGGEVVLIAPTIENQGVIEAEDGRILLAAGESVHISSLDQAGLEFEIQAPEHQVVNLGKLLAERGTVEVFAGTLRHSGEVRADSLQVDDTGAVVLTASADIHLHDSSIVSASGAGGGEVHVEAGGTTWAAGTVEAVGETDSGGPGGRVRLLGERVALTGGARVDVSGDAGGGEVLVGGDFQGKNPAIRNAEQTYVGSDALIAADALSNGDGGRAIVWADDSTRFQGSVTARGGSDSGDGGFVEISGKENLAFTGMVDTSSARGQTGTLLLDPTDIIIEDGSGSADDGEVADGEVLFADGAGEFRISEDALELLATNIRLEATNSITIEDLSGPDNDLELSESVEFAVGTDGSVGMLGEDDSIRLTGTGSLSISGGNLDIGRLSVDGDVDVLAGGAINQTSDVISITGDSSFSAATSISLTTGDNVFGGTVSLVNPGSDAVALRTGNETLLLGDVEIGTGDFTVTGPVTTVTVTEGSTFVKTSGLGTGTVSVPGGFRVEGTLKPGGDDAGGLTIQSIDGSDVVFGPNSSLEIQIGGTEAGTGHDLLTVTGGGNVTLDGSLDVSLLGAFDPGANEFTVVSCQVPGSCTGDFAQENRPAGRTMTVDVGTDLETGNGEVNLSFDALLFQWTGGDGDWSDGSNWTDTGGITGTVPLGRDIAEIDNDGVTVTVPEGFGAAIGELTLADSLVVSGGGAVLTAETSIANSGTLTLNSGATVQVSGGNLTNASGGLIQGVGTIQTPSGAVVNDGTIAPGLSPGKLVIEGDLQLGSTSTLDIELEGTGASDFDQIEVVGGDVTLGGTLRVTLPGSFAPSGSDSFQIISAADGTISGSFASEVPPEGSEMAVAINPNDVTIDGFTAGIIEWIAGSGNWNVASNWSGGAIPVSGQQAVIDNSGVTVTIPANFDASISGLSLADTLVVGGNLAVAAGGSLSGAGQVTVSTGTVTYNGGTLAVDVVNNGLVRFAGGSNTVSAPSSLTGSGVYEFAGGTTTLASGVNYDAATTTINGGTAVFNGTESNTVNLSAGVLGGSGTFLVRNAFNWSGGTISGGTKVIESGAALAIGGTAVKTLSGATLQHQSNTGSSAWSGAGSLTIAGGGTFSNSGRFNIATDADVVSGGGSGSFNNSGTLIKTGGGTTTVGVPLNNTGTLTVNAGVLELTAGGSHGSTFTTGSGASLRFAGGTHNFSSAVFGGAGTVQLSGGSWNNSGAITVGNPFVLTSGNIFGTGTTFADGGTTINGSVSFDGTLENRGTLTWSSGFVGGTGLLANKGRFNVNTASIFSPLVVNSGEVFINATPVSFTSGFNQTSGTLAGSGTIDGNVSALGSSTVAPGGSVGTLTINGDYTQGPGARLLAEVASTAGAGIGNDLLVVEGIATLDGALEVADAGGFVPDEEGTTFEFVRASSLTGGFASFESAAFEVSGAPDVPQAGSYSAVLTPLQAGGTDGGSGEQSPTDSLLSLQDQGEDDLEDLEDDLGVGSEEEDEEKKKRKTLTCK